jgi:hypothetical protein
MLFILCKTLKLYISWYTCIKSTFIKKNKKIGLSFDEQEVS